MGCRSTEYTVDSVTKATQVTGPPTLPPITPAPEPTPPVIMESIPEELQQKEPYTEPEINNGSAYLKQYMGAVYYADNNYIRMALPESRIISGQGYSWYPAALDIYKNDLYYCEDKSEMEAHTLY